jgi:hypothetical protein
MDERDAPSTPPRPTSSSHPARSHRGLRRAGAVLLVVVIALAGVVGLLLLVESRDSSQVDRPASAAAGPGQLFPDQGHAHLQPGQKPQQPYASDPPTSGPHVPQAIDGDRAGTRLDDDQILPALALGDVVMLYGGAEPPAALTALADQLAGPFEPALAATGQAVVLGRRPGTRGIVALAWRHLLQVPDASAPALEQFGAYWLGRGASG